MSVGADDREKLDQLRVLVDDALGFAIFETIEGAKRELSGSDSANVVFTYPSIDVHEPITRAQFEEASRKETDTIMRALDATLADAGVSPGDIELVCCTGGTAKVPRVAAEMRRRFGAERVQDYKSFTSVVEGLAVHARSLAAAA